MENTRKISIDTIQIFGYNKFIIYFYGAQYLDDSNYYPLLLLKPLQTLSFEFTETVMQNKIQQFLWPKPNEIVGKDYQVYGSRVYDSIIDDLTQRSDMNFVDYRVFHMLYEHNKCLQSRMEWLVQHGNMSSKGKEEVIYEKNILYCNIFGGNCVDKCMFA